jgi:hypothetical protein
VRLVRLSVQHFQCIESADVDFGPGLNVLYGPNDLGKSSLAWAIRAALLLQHGAALHQRFIPWYGGGEPHVTLTLCDDDDRTWRVSKTFGAGTVGRSRLESSKDGREGSFTTEATGRQVDDQLRLMLRWGVQRPGGAGPRGLPSSFLTQVLLAEQADVLRILDGESLATDPDPSGRVRLTGALDALAQDPLFKRVLDAAQAAMDSAFTSTGRKKGSRGSPLSAIADLITTMQRERDELEGKVKDTAAAEARIHTLGAQRAELHHQVEASRAALDVARKQQAARQRRDDLRARLAAEQAKIAGVEDLERQIDRLRAEAPQRQAAEAASAAGLQHARIAARDREAERDAARARLDALTHLDRAGEEALRALEERRRIAEERLAEAGRAVEREAEALRLARTCAVAVAEAATAAVAGREASRVADETATAEAAAVARAQLALDDARQQLREAESGDRLEALHRRRAELENQRLTLEAARAEAARAAERAASVGQAVKQAEEAERARDAFAGDVDRARAAVAAHEEAVAAAEAARARSGKVELFAQLRLAGKELVAVRQASAAAEAARARAVLLREEAAALRAQVPDDLPAALAIAGVRALRDELRVAEARLGGGLSVTVRSARAVVLQAAPDGVAGAPRKMPAGDEVTLAANRELSLGIEGLVEIEVSAGDSSARKAAAELKKRWSREGARLLRAHKVESIEALEARRAEADIALRAAADRDREAEQAEQRAAPVPAAGEEALRARLAALEKALEGEDRRALTAALDAPEAGGPEALDQRGAALERERQARAAELASAREQLTRLETQREGQAREAETRRQEASRRQADLPGDWAAAVAHQQAAVQAADHALAETAAAVARLSGRESSEEQAARARLASAEQALAAAAHRRDQAEITARSARDAAVQATTRLEDARARARELDRTGAWTQALKETAPELPVASWQVALATAGQRNDDCQRERAAVVAELARLDDERRTAILRGREASAGAEERWRVARERLEEGEAGARGLAGEHQRIAHHLGEMRVQVAGANVTEGRRVVAALAAELAALEAEAGVDPVQSLDEQEKTSARLAALLRDTEDELARARGALEQVGGAVVRERQRELDQALGQARDRERATETAFDGWKLLVETLRASESAEGAHLGRALAGPVSARFRSLTGGRYGGLELGPHLEAGGLRAAGDVREIGALSAGTQDQLATLLRVCIAEHLRSAIVLDDHLSQSDPDRVAWFNDVLRSAARTVQIILITCRPSEVLAPDERPASGQAVHSGAAGLLRVVDLTQVIKRFGPLPSQLLDPGA